MRHKKIKAGRSTAIFTICICITAVSFGLDKSEKISELTSKSTYYTWNNNATEGTTERHTLINLAFFEWLHDEYGMNLDIYFFDAGGIDTVTNQYGNMDSEKFRRQFPNGFGPLCEKAEAIGCRLGVWLGPDGFGETPEEEQRRTDMLVSLCRDYNFVLFKFDKVCSDLRAEKIDAFIRMLEACRTYSPDLIVLNHRLDLGKATPYTTTFLWQGRETYIDSLLCNTAPATHHRQGAIVSGLTPDLGRKEEDCGVCFSSYPEHWEDDLVIHAFGRSLILAPEIYGDPWFLPDEDFPKLARFFNLHRRYRNILINGMELPAERYGPDAVSRGDDAVRFLVLKNSGWNPVSYSIVLDESIGLKKADWVDLRRFHPSEHVLGRFPWGATVEVEVLAFGACLLMATTEPSSEIAVQGCDYEVVRDTPGKPVLLKLLGMPGTQAQIKLADVKKNKKLPAKWKRAILDGKDVSGLISGKTIDVLFPGKKQTQAWHRKLADLQTHTVPDDAEALYEASCFVASSNALEIQALKWSGPSRIPVVQDARQAFLTQESFIRRSTWDRYVFDGDKDTSFVAQKEGGSLRVNFGKTVPIDEIIIRTSDNASVSTAEVSSDLKIWYTVPAELINGAIHLKQLPEKKIQYLRLDKTPLRISEIEAVYHGQQLDRTGWRASNLLPSFAQLNILNAKSAVIQLDEIPRGGYLAIPIFGPNQRSHGLPGVEGAYAAARVNGKPLGAPGRCLSYPYNLWIHPYASNKNYTYYIPLNPQMLGKEIEVFVLGTQNDTEQQKMEVWLTAYPIPFEARELMLQ